MNTLIASLVGGNILSAGRAGTGMMTSAPSLEAADLLIMDCVGSVQLAWIQCKLVLSRSPTAQWRTNMHLTDDTPSVPLSTFILKDQSMNSQVTITIQQPITKPYDCIL